MKKLLLLILLSTSLSANALSIELPTPCIDKFFMKLLEDELEELTKLSNSDKDNLTYKNQIDELQVDIYELVGSICRKSPEGNLVNEKREGVWTWYDEYNNPAKFGNYKNGLKEGLWIERHTDSNFETQMFYKNDVLDGKYTIYGYMSPFDVVKIQIRKAELEAKLESAKLQGFQDLVNHFTEQLETLDYPKIITEGYYLNGKRDGYWKELKGGGNYINGVKDGAWDEGSSKGNYINGNKDGIWSYSYSFGEVYKEEVYEDGVLIEKKFI
jgi:antitoxin component YwqK of YwqJK toxin-antitoxin module